MAKKIYTPKAAIALALICTFFISIGQLFYKLGSERVTGIISLFNIFVIAGIIFYFLGSILYIAALKKGELTVIAPLLALNYIWVVLLSIIFLGELASALRWSGVAFVVIGVSFIGVGGRYGY